MEQITSFHTYVTIIITLIALFVLGAPGLRDGPLQREA